MTVTLRMILPTSSAPYALRFVTDDLKVDEPGARAVDFRYSLARDSYEARITEYDGKLWRHVSTKQDAIRKLDKDQAREIANNLLAELRDADTPASDLRAGLQELREALDNDQPIGLSDEEIFDLIEGAADELVRRLPRYALDQGDLEGSDEPAIEARENLLVEIRAAKDKIVGGEE